MRFLFLTVIIIICFSARTQSILVGEKVGAGIVYEDIPDVYIEGTTFDGSESTYIDFNQDGKIDLWLNAFATYNSHIDQWSSVLLASPNNEFQLALYQSDTNLIDYTLFNSIINEELNWTKNSHNYTFFQCSNSGSEGQLFGDCYFAFRIIGQDTTYGWVHMNGNCQFTSSSLTIYEFAYKVIFSGVKEDLKTNIKVNYIPEMDIIIIEVPKTINGEKLFFNIYNTTGIKLLTGKLQNGNNQINLQFLSNSFIILHITDCQGHYLSLKFIKK